MNSNTRDLFKAFLDQVEILAQGVIHMTGSADAGRLIAAAEELKDQLDSDETIV